MVVGGAPNGTGGSGAPEAHVDPVVGGGVGVGRHRPRRTVLVTPLPATAPSAGATRRSRRTGGRKVPMINGVVAVRGVVRHDVGGARRHRHGAGRGGVLPAAGRLPVEGDIGQAGPVGPPATDVGAGVRRTSEGAPSTTPAAETWNLTPSSTALVSPPSLLAGTAVSGHRLDTVVSPVVKLHITGAAMVLPDWSRAPDTDACTPRSTPARPSA